MPVDPDLAKTLRTLLERQRIASLGTLHKGEPYVSMVPFALLAGVVFVQDALEEYTATATEQLADVLFVSWRFGF